MRTPVAVGVVSGGPADADGLVEAAERHDRRLVAHSPRCSCPEPAGCGA